MVRHSYEGLGDDVKQSADGITVFMTLADTSTCSRSLCISIRGRATAVVLCELKASALAIFAAFLSMPVSPF